MTTLGKALHDTIKRLELIRDTSNPPPVEIYASLDKLYEAQMQLIDAAIQQSSSEYVLATTAMEEAASKTLEAIGDLKKLETALEKIADAIAKIAPLITVLI